MPNNTRIYWIHTLTPTHVGTGRGVGYIDLPIHRDKLTNWPVVPGSAFKGVWADHFRADETNRRANPQLRVAFGLADDSQTISANSGALMPTDARIVCLPVRSFSGTFAWCTSRMALHLLHRDLELSGFANLPPLPAAVSDGEIYLAQQSALKMTINNTDRVYLEELDFTAVENRAGVQDWAQKIAEWVLPLDWRTDFQGRFAVVSDSVFDFFTEMGTEVNARVRIDDDTKTVADGQLWYEEALPAETILAGLVVCDRVFDTKAGVTPQQLLDAYANTELNLQIGGKATVGRGRVRCIFTN